VSFTPRFRLRLAHGWCVGVTLPGAGEAGGGDVGEIPEHVLAQLAEAERRHAETLPPWRRVTWIGGRLALRAALADASMDAGAAIAILATARGAPSLPAGAVGSISHKDELAVGLAAPAADGWQLGVDVERIRAGRPDISRLALRPEERARLAPPGDPRRAEQVLSAFSAKESIYKALDPFVGRHVSYDEASVELRADGTAAAGLHLRARRGAPPPAAIEGPFDVEVTWLRPEEGVVVTTARVRRRGC
jgi:4'-phosphopantetheinyl transferase EntD